MIRLKVNKEVFDMPQTWGELTVEQYLKVINTTATNQEIIDTLACKPVNPLFIEVIYPFLKWLEKPIDIEQYKTNEKINIKDYSFGKYILLELDLQKKENVIKAYSIYFDENKILAEALPIANKIINQFFECKKWESEHLGFKPTNEQVRAGIDKFDQFGRQNTIDMLANGDVLKYDSVLALDVNTVFAKLKRIKIENDFQRNYQKIMSEKK